MFQARLSQGIILKKIIEALRELVTDVNLDISKEGISLQAMDASHVALVTFFLRAEYFQDFHCDRPQTLGISIGSLGKVIKCAENEDSIVIRAEDNASLITFIFEGKHDDRVSEFNLNLLTLETEHMGIPDQEYAAIIQIPSPEFNRICKELSQLSDTLNIDITKERVIFSVNGDTGRGAISLTQKNDKNIIEVINNVNASFALRYLNLFNKASTLSNNVILSVSEDLPLIVRYDFEIGIMKYYLAPKINDEFT
jgi:proliferating cell nuclear antigen